MIKRTKQGKSEIIGPANGCIEARRGAFSSRLSYCENQARLLWWGRLAQRNMVVDKNKKNNATFNLLSSMEKPGSKGGELSFRHCVAASTAAAAAASTAYLTRLQTIIFL